MEEEKKLFIIVSYPEDLNPTGFTEITQPESFSTKEKIENIKKILGKKELDIRQFDNKGPTIIILDGEDFVNIINICNNSFQPWSVFPYEINLTK